jgi:hypothetical protein
MVTFSRWSLVPLILAIWALAMACALVLPSWNDNDNAGVGRVRGTIRLALTCWFLAVLIMPGLDRNGWREGGPGGLVRWTWTLGWIAYVVHVALAFHYHFGWSHAAAIAHTQARSGVGEGIYVSHAFTILWGADVIWWWLAPDGYARRSAWSGGVLHGFLGFIIFNGTVVYETGMVRWVGAAAFVVLGVRLMPRLWNALPGRPLAMRRQRHQAIGTPPAD